MEEEESDTGWLGGFTRIRANLSASLAPVPPDSMLTDPNVNPNLNPVNHTKALHSLSELQNVKKIHRENKILPKVHKLQQIYHLDKTDWKRLLYQPYLWYFATLTTVHRGRAGLCVNKCTLHRRRIAKTADFDRAQRERNWLIPLLLSWALISSYLPYNDLQVAVVAPIKHQIRWRCKNLFYVLAKVHTPAT